MKNFKISLQVRYCPILQDLSIRLTAQVAAPSYVSTVSGAGAQDMSLPIPHPLSRPVAAQANAST